MPVLTRLNAEEGAGRRLPTPRDVVQPDSQEGATPGAEEQGHAGGAARSGPRRCTRRRIGPPWSGCPPPDNNARARRRVQQQPGASTIHQSSATPLASTGAARPKRDSRHQRKRPGRATQRRVPIAHLAAVPKPGRWMEDIHRTMVRSMTSACPA